MASSRLFASTSQALTEIAAQQEREWLAAYAEMGIRNGEPRADADWRNQRLFVSGPYLEGEIAREVRGNGSSLLREWFHALGFGTAESQREFLKEQRRLHLEGDPRG